MRKLLGLLAAFALLLTALPANAEGTRVFNNAHRPYRLLAKQYSTGANVFPTADPSPAGTPLALTNAMGFSPVDGVVTLALEAGFTAPVTLTAYYWQYDEKATGTAGWVRASNIAANYQAAVDSTYASVSFSVPGNTPFIVSSSAADTGNVYCSAPADTHNLGSSATGY